MTSSSRICSVCHGNGELEHGTVQDSFGQWDTVTYPCEACDGAGVIHEGTPDAES